MFPKQSGGTYWFYSVSFYYYYYVAPTEGRATYCFWSVSLSYLVIIIILLPHLAVLRIFSQEPLNRLWWNFAETISSMSKCFCNISKCRHMILPRGRLNLPLLRPSPVLPKKKLKSPDFSKFQKFFFFFFTKNI
jgi:hypothetical protein